MKTLDLPSQSAGSENQFVKPNRFTPEQRQPYIIACIALWSVLAYLFISHFIIMAVQIKGASMWPTLLDGQRYMLVRCQYLWRAPREGEIVVIRDPEDHNLSIKRVIGLPNELFEIRRDGIYLDGQKLPEPYLTSKAAADSGNKLVKPTRLGPQQYFVMGDNRDWSADSRIYGPISRAAILGHINK
jgi:signal peptidase I